MMKDFLKSHRVFLLKEENLWFKQSGRSGETVYGVVYKNNQFLPKETKVENLGREPSEQENPFY